MKPAEFDYASPETLADVTSLLSANADAKVLAGGQSLIPLLSFRLASPSLLVDLRLVPGLDHVARDNGTIRIGAMVRQRTAEQSDVIRGGCPLLRDALAFVAHPQIRSRGTVGGSIAHADPAAELPAVLVALDGCVHVQGPTGTRTVEARDLYRTFFTTTLADDEVLTEVELPAVPPRTGTACVQVARRAGDYALGGALAQVTLDERGAVSDARLALLGVGQRPARAGAAEETLRGSRPDAAALAAAGEAAADGLVPADDSQASAEYRVHLAQVLSRRALGQALERVA